MMFAAPLARLNRANDAPRWKVATIYDLRRILQDTPQ